MPDIHCTGKHSQVAGDCKSKGDRTPLIFAKFGTAHCWHLGAWASEQTPGSVGSGCARGFCHFPDWALCRLFHGLFCHEQLLHFILYRIVGKKIALVLLWEVSLKVGCKTHSCLLCCLLEHIIYCSNIWHLLRGAGLLIPLWLWELSTGPGQILLHYSYFFWLVLFEVAFLLRSPGLGFWGFFSTKVHTVKHESGGYDYPILPHFVWKLSQTENLH